MLQVGAVGQPQERQGLRRLGIGLLRQQDHEMQGVQIGRKR